MCSGPCETPTRYSFCNSLATMHNSCFIVLGTLVCWVDMRSGRFRSLFGYGLGISSHVLGKVDWSGTLQQLPIITVLCCGLWRRYVGSAVCTLLWFLTGCGPSCDKSRWSTQVVQRHGQQQRSRGSIMPPRHKKTSSFNARISSFITNNILP